MFVQIIIQAVGIMLLALVAGALVLVAVAAALDLYDHLFRTDKERGGGVAPAPSHDGPRRSAP